MKTRIATDSLMHEFRILRNRIESEIHAPAVILVTSATERDGAHLTAFGLAESLSKTHQRAALVTTSAPASAAPQFAAAAKPAQQQRRASDRLEAPDVRGPGELSVVAISRERFATLSRSSAAEMVRELRDKHDYVVIDGGDLPKNSFALLMVASVDVTLVTFLAGRQKAPADRAMLDLLERSEAKVLGVVMTDQESIDHFANRDAATEMHDAQVEKKSSNRLVLALQRMGKPF